MGPFFWLLLTTFFSIMIPVSPLMGKEFQKKTLYGKRGVKSIEKGKEEVPWGWKMGNKNLEVPFSLAGALFIFSDLLLGNFPDGENFFIYQLKGDLKTILPGRIYSLGPRGLLVGKKTSNLKTQQEIHHLTLIPPEKLRGLKSLSLKDFKVTLPEGMVPNCFSDGNHSLVRVEGGVLDLLSNLVYPLKGLSDQTSLEFLTPPMGNPLISYPSGESLLVWSLNPTPTLFWEGEGDRLVGSSFHGDVLVLAKKNSAGIESVEMVNSQDGSIYHRLSDEVLPRGSKLKEVWFLNREMDFKFVVENRGGDLQFFKSNLFRPFHQKSPEKIQAWRVPSWDNSHPTLFLKDERGNYIQEKGEQVLLFPVNEDFKRKKSIFFGAVVGGTSLYYFAGNSLKSMNLLNGKIVPLLGG